MYLPYAKQLRIERSLVKYLGCSIGCEQNGDRCLRMMKVAIFALGD